MVVPFANLRLVDPGTPANDDTLLVFPVAVHGQARPWRELQQHRLIRRRELHHAHTSHQITKAVLVRAHERDTADTIPGFPNARHQALTHAETLIGCGFDRDEMFGDLVPDRLRAFGIVRIHRMSSGHGVSRSPAA
jgi:hypothetical protein